MKVLIPIAHDHQQMPEVDAGIMAQTVPCEIIYHRGRNTGLSHMDMVVSGTACENRNILRQYADGKYTVMMDSDVDLRPCPTVFQCCQIYLDYHTDVDVVAVSTKGHTGRGVICEACCMWRTEALRAYTFVATKEECCCVDMGRKLKVRWLNQATELRRKK